MPSHRRIIVSSTARRCQNDTNRLTPSPRPSAPLAPSSSEDTDKVTLRAPQRIASGLSVIWDGPAHSFLGPGTVSFASMPGARDDCRDNRGTEVHESQNHKVNFPPFLRTRSPADEWEKGGVIVCPDFQVRLGFWQAGHCG
jgi:hypothetical protein